MQGADSTRGRLQSQKKKMTIIDHVRDVWCSHLSVLLEVSSAVLAGLSVWVFHGPVCTHSKNKKHYYKKEAFALEVAVLTHLIG